MAKQPIKYFVVNAFAESAFKGNPAAVVLLDEEKDDVWLQHLADEFRISATCFPVRLTDSESDTGVPRFRLRWFTPVSEVKLCGHATLAAAYVLFSSGSVTSNVIEFSTLSGILTAKKILDDIKSEKFSIELDFPGIQTITDDALVVSSLSKALKGLTVLEVKKTTTENDLFVVVLSGKSVVNFKPDVDVIRECPGRGLIITGIGSPNDEFDFFSRFFYPKIGVPEGPVCGSAHCALAVYWSKELGKKDFVAYAASPRGGIVKLHVDEQRQRVLLKGKAVTTMEGDILI